MENSRLLFAGSGDLIKDLQDEAAQLGIREKVFFLGSIAEDDLPHVYRAAHVFSLVSDRGQGRGEGIPLTPLEAAACGVPIIVGNQDGSQEAVASDDSNGYVIDPFDVEHHSEVLRLLTADKGLREVMAQDARRVVERDMAYTVFREKHRMLLDTAVARRFHR
jgi:phosphatidylinositol alpha-1,6-mannosyltransferase